MLQADLAYWRHDCNDQLIVVSPGTGDRLANMKDKRAVVAYVVPHGGISPESRSRDENESEK